MISERVYKQTANEIIDLFEKFGDEDYDGDPFLKHRT